MSHLTVVGALLSATNCWDAPLGVAGVIWGLHSGYMGILENKVETNIVYIGLIMLFLPKKTLGNVCPRKVRL